MKAQRAQIYDKKKAHLFVEALPQGRPAPATHFQPLKSRLPAVDIEAVDLLPTRSIFYKIGRDRRIDAPTIIYGQGFTPIGWCGSGLITPPYYTYGMKPYVTYSVT